MIKVFFILIICFIGNSFVYAISIKETITLTLQQNSAIQIKKEEQHDYKGLLIQSNQKFDTNFNLTSYYEQKQTPQSIYLSDKTSDVDTLNYEASVSKYFDNGVTVESGVIYNESQLQYSNSNTQYNYNQSNVYFTINKALFKNSTEEIITADKKLSQYDVDISNYSFKSQLNSSLYNSIQAYWEFVYAYKKTKLDLEAKQRAMILIDNINELIISDTKPRADILQPKASLNTKELTLLNSQRLLSDKRYDFGMNVGNNLEDNLRVKIPSDDFPYPTIQRLTLLENRQYFSSIALRQRMDLKTLDTQIKKSKLVISVAKDSLKSDFDVSLRGSYDGINRDKNINSSIENLHSNDMSGNSVKVALQYTLPIENSYANGLYLSSKSKLSQSKINFDELKRNIEYDVNKLLDQLKITILSFKQIEVSVKNYIDALQNEKIKYTMGFSTTLNIIQTEDSLYAEKVKRLDILKTYALQIAKLHYITSNIIEESENLNIDYKKFYAIKWNNHE